MIFFLLHRYLHQPIFLHSKPTFYFLLIYAVVGGAREGQAAYLGNLFWIARGHKLGEKFLVEQVKQGDGLDRLLSHDGWLPPVLTINLGCNSENTSRYVFRGKRGQGLILETMK